MQILDLEQLEARTEEFDRAVFATPDIDRFCSSSTWILPANSALMPPREPWLRETENGYIALMRGSHERVGHYLQPLEAAWCFTNGLVGSKPTALVRDLFLHCQDQRPEWDVLLLGGMCIESDMMDALVANFGHRYRIFTGMTTRRHMASLDGGVDGFLSRRSKNFRRGLKRSRNRLKGHDIDFCAVAPEAVGSCEALYQRILAVEERSWKGMAGAGINQGTMQEFYHRMLPRLVESGQLRLRFAVQDGQDLGFIMGAVHGTTYRGLQFSFDNQYRGLGLGNLLQMNQIQSLAEEGVALYDLGSDAPYKARWAEVQLDTLMVIIRP